MPNCVSDTYTNPDLNNRRNRLLLHQRSARPIGLCAQIPISHGQAQQKMAEEMVVAQLECVQSDEQLPSFQAPGKRIIGARFPIA